MSIPFFFTPERDQGMRVFDGGLRNNYPVEALLRDKPTARDDWVDRWTSQTRDALMSCSIHSWTYFMRPAKAEMQRLHAA